MPKDERAREGYLSEMPVHETSCSLVPACNPARLPPPRACKPRAPATLRPMLPMLPASNAAPHAPAPSCGQPGPPLPPLRPAAVPMPTRHAPRPPVVSQRLKEYFVAQLQPRGVALCLVLADIYKGP